MRRMLSIVICFGLAAAASAEQKEINGKRYNVFPNRERAAKTFARTGHGPQLVYHGGDILPAAHVVPIYWGSYWGSGTGATERSAMNSFFEQFGTTSHYGVITQYYDTTTGSTRYIGLSTLMNSGGDFYDSSQPPTNVTDADVQAEVQAYLSNHAFDDQAIYHVFIPPTSYSSFSTYTSCGGPNLYYCAYHSSYHVGGSEGYDVKYAIEPYPSCSGCQWSGWTAAQNLQHFSCHETREAVTDPVNAWYDRSGNEADDKCAWSPAPFLDGGFGYQWEWSNADKTCVQ